MPREKKYWALLAILAVAAVVRFVGIDFGLPHTLCRPDESTIVDKAWFVFQGDPNPHFFNYPSLFIYLVAALFSIRFSVLALCGTPAATLNAELYANPAPLFLVPRIVSASLGSLTVIMVYLVAKRAFDRKTAFLSALFMSICYLHARDSHFGTTDVTMTFLAVCAVLFMLRAHSPHPSPLPQGKREEKGVLRDHVLAGVFTGLATSTKYGAMFLVVPMVAAHLLTGKGRNTRMGILWYFVAAAAAFAITTPFALLDFRTFFLHFVSEARHLAVGENIWGEPMRFGRGWWYHARHTLPYGAGILTILAAVAGICMAIIKDARKAIVVMAFPIVYYIVAGRGYTVFVRYMIPVLPFICIAAAVFCVHISARLPTPATARATLALLAFLLAAEPIANIYMFNVLISRRDNRLVVHDWMADALPDGSTVYQTGKPFGHALLPPTLRPFRMGEDAGEDLPDYMIVHRHPLAASKVHDRIEELVRTEYEPLRTFTASARTARRSWFDRMDAFYLPLRGFRGIARPGPDTEVYRRRPPSPPIGE
ncbi:glycosyltransferase family 39 protein [Verrucomicrobiota bacterium]